MGEPREVEAFAAMPLAEQVGVLERRLGSEEPRQLLALASALRDHAPLAWLCRTLLERGWLADGARRGDFARFLLERPDTAVDKVLRSLQGAGGARAQADLAASLVELLRLAPVACLSSSCLVDRFLKHNATEVRDRYVGSVVAECVEALRAGRPEVVTVHRLAQVPARAIPELREAAEDAGVAAAFEATREGLARAVVDVLGSAPKAVSQANAEELLSRRVYTDPGHFLIELLQNAEDAGARTWRVRFDARRIVVWHDGAPFDARDVVGVTSIGQTTKRKQQIGFFGVGFKSVYEVTERPQVFSDAYAFEIADVSIPKALAGRPADLPAEGTVLVLPLRAPDDPVRSPAALFEKARALDPVVLFTLREIEVIDLELGAAAGGPARYAIHEIVEPAAGRSVIRQEPEGWTRSYALEAEEVAYDAGLREPGRPDRTTVMVGALLDGEGRPTPLGQASPTVYSYLPTDERSGLRFFVQGHFDVPVDRERITQDSGWNRWVLTKVPALLARLAARHGGGARGPEAAAFGAGLLAVLPLASELASPIFRVVTSGLRAAFAGVPALPCTDGRLHEAGETLVAPAQLASLFDGRVASIAGRGARSFLDPGLDGRAVEVARSLGCEAFDLDRLVGLLEAVLAGVPEGGRAGPGAAPAFLAAPTPGEVARLYEAIEGELLALERSGRRLAATRLTERLEELPLVLGAEGGFHRARPPGGSRPARGCPAIRAAFDGLRTFVHEELDGGATSLDCDGEGEASEALRPSLPPGLAAAFLERLGVEALDVRHLVRALEAELAGAPSPLEGPDAAALPGSEARLERIMEVVAEAPHGLLTRVLRLPLFHGVDGRLHPVATSQRDRRGVLAAGGDAVSEALRRLYGKARPIAAASPASAEATVLGRARAPALGFDTLVADLADEQGPLPRDVASLRELHALLEALRGEVPLRVRKELARLPIWPDTRGAARPLRGEGAAYLPAHDDVRGLFPDAPFVDPEVGARRHVSDLGVETVGAAAVVDALEPDAAPPLRIEPSPAWVEAALRFLLAHGDGLRARSREKLARLPAFLSDRGVPTRLADLRRARSPGLRALYGDLEGRHFVEDGGLAVEVLRALELEGRLTEADEATLIEDLHGLRHRLLGARPGEGRPEPPIVPTPQRLVALHRLLAEAAQGRLSAAMARRALDLAIFPDCEGRLGVLRTARGEAPTDGAEVTACDPAFRELLGLAPPAGLRLLAGDAQERLEPLLEAGGARRAGLEDLLAALAALAPVAPGATPVALQSGPALRAIHAQLLARREWLLVRAGPARAASGGDVLDLSTLAIWPTAAGGVVAASSLVLGDALLCLAAPGSPERAVLDASRVAEGARQALEALAPMVAPRPDAALLVELLDRFARPGAPLPQQPAFLRTIKDVAAAAALLGWADREAEPPLVDGLGRLRREPLRRCDGETFALLEGTSLAAELVHPELLPLLDAAVLARAAPLEPSEALRAVEACPMVREPARRAAFYRWLLSHEATAFADPELRARLREAPLFATAGGRLVSPAELVVDRTLPDLGIDWQPHAEVPEATLDLLARHLGVGRPEPDDLARRHVLPVYVESAATGDRERAGALFAWLARALEGRSALELGALLGPGEPGGLLIEDGNGAFRPPADLLLPLSEIEGWVRLALGDEAQRPSPERYGEEARGFLLRLGVRRVPPLAAVARAMESGPCDADPASALALAGLVGFLCRGDPDAAGALPLRSAAWVLDGTGCQRRPTELFLWTPEAEALLGDFRELYPDPRVAPLLGEALAGRIGLRTLADVRVEDVVRHVLHRSAAGAMVPFRVYQWLEAGLAEGWLDSGALAALVGRSAWICVDDGTWWGHGKTVGFSALRLFGGRRGAWERGAERCPALCRAFRIPTAETAAAVVGLLEEVAAEVQAEGDRPVLEREPALPRMLLACAAFLGEGGTRIDPGLAVVPCAERGHGRGAEEGRAALRLLPPGDRRLLRSDTPTLEALFAGVGTFFVASPGSAEDRASVDRFLETNGVRRLREAYTVEAEGADDAGPCVREAELGRLRSVLRALAAVMPRVRAQRTLLPAEGWVDEARLRPLAAAGSVRATPGLKVRYRLIGVGEVAAEVEAVYDPARAELLVERRALEDPAAAATGLAVGLMRCIYDGPGEDQVVDIVEILVGLGTRERMDAYLDRRHFPAAPAGARSARDRLAERIDEVLDYGLGERLGERFPEIGQGADLEALREPGLLSRIFPPESEEPGSLEDGARRALPLLLDAAGVREPSPELSTTLFALLSAESLSEVSPAVYGGGPSGPEVEGLEGPRSAPLPSRGLEAVGGGAAGGGAEWTPPPLDELLERLEGAVDRGGALELGPAATHEAPSPPFPIAEGGDEGGDGGPGTGEPAGGEPLEADRAPGTASMWNRLRRLLGLAGHEAAPPEAEAPRWASSGGNPFAPAVAVPSQLWATPEARRAVRSLAPAGRLVHAPARLPPPHRYALHLHGATFEPATQRWLPAGTPWPPVALCPGAPTGRTVAVQGRVPPGESRLPLPLYSRLAARPEIVAGPKEALAAFGVGPAGSLRVQLRGDAPVVLRYVAELLRAPALTSREGRVELDLAARRLVRPTIPRRELPAEVRRWLDAAGSSTRPDWELAVEAQALVRARYGYDDGFLARPEVVRRRARLEPGEGNHHLELLHAASGDGLLGRGICYELNALLVELLRHLGVPAMVGTGWVLMDGAVDRPDHLFALAILPSERGPALMPLDAAVGPRGPIRPVGSSRAGLEGGASGPGLGPAPEVPDVPGPWSAAAVAPTTATGPEQLRAAEESRLAAEEALLRRAIALAARLSPTETGAREPAAGLGDGPLADRVRRLREEAQRLLPQPELLEALLEVIGGGAASVSTLTPTLRALVRLGLVRAREVPTVELWPADSAPPGEDPANERAAGQ